MTSRDTVLLTILTIAAGLIIGAVIARFLEREDAAWIAEVYSDRDSPDDLSPAQLAELHEEARRILGDPL